MCVDTTQSKSMAGKHENLKTIPSQNMAQRAESSSLQVHSPVGETQEETSSTELPLPWPPTPFGDRLLPLSHGPLLPSVTAYFLSPMTPPTPFHSTLLSSCKHMHHIHDVWNPCGLETFIWRTLNLTFLSTNNLCYLIL